MEKSKREDVLPRVSRGGAAGGAGLRASDLLTKNGEAAPANSQATAAAGIAKTKAAATIPSRSQAAATSATSRAAVAKSTAAAPAHSAAGTTSAPAAEGLASLSTHATEVAGSPSAAAEHAAPAGRRAGIPAAAAASAGAAADGGAAATAAPSPACRLPRTAVKAAGGGAAATGSVHSQSINKAATAAEKKDAKLVAAAAAAASGGLPADEVLRGRHIRPSSPSAARATVRFSDQLLSGSSKSAPAAAASQRHEAASSSWTPSAAAEDGEFLAPAPAVTGAVASVESEAAAAFSGVGLTPPAAARESPAVTAAADARVGVVAAAAEEGTAKFGGEGAGEPQGYSDADSCGVAPSRQASKGYTGETWYDFDLPLGRSDPITIIHFNDIYNIESPPDGAGGVARFVTAMQQYQHLHPFILFSGDVFNPSVMSTYTRGRHMVPFLNILKIHTACFGNHDFDFGVDELEYAVGSCNFPWLLSNVFQKTAAEEQLQRQLQKEQQRRRTSRLGGGASVAATAAGRGGGRQATEQENEQARGDAGGAGGAGRRRETRGSEVPTRSGSFCLPRLSALRTMDETAYQEVISRRSPPARGHSPPPVPPAGGEDASPSTAAASPRAAANAAAAAGLTEWLGEDAACLGGSDDSEEEEVSSGRFVEDYIEVHGLPLANGMKYRLCEWQGVKVGLIGLVESEWLDTLGSIDQDDVCYVDFVRAANCLSRVLRQKECELVIALTHMRAPNDEKLAREAEDIDLILGGHDHEYYGLQRIGNVPVVKSGTDFRDFTVITIYPGSLAKDKERRSNSSSPGTSSSTDGLSRACCSSPLSTPTAASHRLSMQVGDGSNPTLPSPGTGSAAFSTVVAAASGAAGVTSSFSSPAPAAVAAAAAAGQGEGARGVVATQRESRMLLSLPSGSRRCRSSSSGGGSKDPSRLTKSEGSSPVQSPCLRASGSSSSSSGRMHTRAPGLVEAKPRTRKEPPPKQFNVAGAAGSSGISAGPLRPSDVSEGEEEMPFFLGGSRVQWKRVHVDPRVFPKNCHVERLVKRYEEQVQEQMQKYLVDVGCELDTRFASLRTRETNVGSWICDVIRRECKADIAILNSGTIRSDCLFPVGQLKFGDLARMLPMADDMCVIGVSGEILLQALENSVSLLPRTEGRFLQVAGLRFAFDSRRPPGQRVLRSSVRVASARWSAHATSFSSRASRSASSASSSFFLRRKTGAEEAGVLKKEDQLDGEKAGAEEYSNFSKLELDREYSVATKTYVAQGRDGYHMLQGCRVLVEAELLAPLPTMVRGALSMAELANGIKRPHSRIVFKRLTSFTSMHEDEMLKDFGCKVNESSRYVLAPRTDGRIRDIAAEQPH